MFIQLKFIVQIQCNQFCEKCPACPLPGSISSSSLLFADDTKLFRPITNYHSFQRLQDDISIVEQWSKLWQLNFNTKKLHLGRNNPNYTYCIGGDQLHSVKEYKDLGVLMDSIHSHMSAVANKANQLLVL